MLTRLQPHAAPCHHKDVAIQVRFEPLVAAVVPGPASITITAVDRFKNRAWISYPAELTVLVDGTTTLPLTLTDGQAQISYGQTTAEAVVLSLQQQQALAIDLSATATLTFKAADTATIRVVALTSDTVDALIEGRAEAFDAFGNKNPEANLSVVLKVSGSASIVGDATLSITGGEGIFQLSNQIDEEVVVSFEPFAGLDMTHAKAVRFLSGAVMRYVLLELADVTVDEAATVIIHALDQYDNVARSTNEPNRLLLQGNSETLLNLGVVAIIDGVGRRSVRNTKNERVVIELLDGSSVVDSRSVIFDAGLPVKVLFDSLAAHTATVDASFDVGLRAVDQFGNVAVTEGRKVTVIVGGVGTPATLEAQLSAGLAAVTLAPTEDQTIVLGLQDDFNTLLDVSSTLNVSVDPGAPAVRTNAPNLLISMPRRSISTSNRSLWIRFSTPKVSYHPCPFHKLCTQIPPLTCSYHCATPTRRPLALVLHPLPGAAVFVVYELPAQASPSGWC